MKTLVFRNAWTIYRNTQVSFSEALRAAWKAFKNGVTIYVQKCNRLVKSVGLGFHTEFFNAVSYMKNGHSTESISSTIEFDGFNESNNDGARLYYGVGRYCGD